MKKSVSIILLQLFYCLGVFAQQVAGIPNLGLPAITPNDVVITHLGYTLSYNEKHEQANWVAYELTAEETQKAVERSNDFRPDTAVHTGSATNQDYLASGYDRGHLAPAADMGWSLQAMEESFFYSNMSPQVPGFNRGIWKKLEEKIRQWATDNQAIYVVTGPVLEDSLPTIGPEKVSVPRAYYKVILDYTLPGIKAIAFILPNASSSLPLQDFAVPIDSVESVTGIDFFPALPDNKERAIEKTFCMSCWSWTSTATHRPAVQYKDTTFSTKQVGKVRCSAITKSGTRCKRMTSNPSGICSQHEK